MGGSLPRRRRRRLFSSTSPPPPAASPLPLQAMWSIRALLLVLLAFLGSTQALLLQTAGHMGLHSADAAITRTDGCPCMRCRTNLKKDKRQRNRVNAFRFTKGPVFKRRFTGPDYAAEQKKSDEDNKFFSLVFTYSAEEAAAAQAEAAKAPAE